jgi:hypothetical protein
VNTKYDNLRLNKKLHVGLHPTMRIKTEMNTPLENLKPFARKRTFTMLQPRLFAQLPRIQRLVINLIKILLLASTKEPISINPTILQPKRVELVKLGMAHANYWSRQGSYRSIDLVSRFQTE